MKVLKPDTTGHVLRHVTGPGGSAGKEPTWGAGALRDAGLIPGWGGSPGGGHGNPLQYSCLGNARGRGAGRAAVHGVAESQLGWSTSTLRALSREGPTFGCLLACLGKIQITCRMAGCLPCCTGCLDVPGLPLETCPPPPPECPSEPSADGDTEPHGPFRKPAPPLPALPTLTRRLVLILRLPQAARGMSS